MYCDLLLTIDISVFNTQQPQGCAGECHFTAQGGVRHTPQVAEHLQDLQTDELSCRLGLKPAEDRKSRQSGRLVKGKVTVFTSSTSQRHTEKV